MKTNVKYWVRHLIVFFITLKEPSPISIKLTWSSPSNGSADFNNPNKLVLLPGEGGGVTIETWFWFLLSEPKQHFHSWFNISIKLKTFIQITKQKIKCFK